MLSVAFSNLEDVEDPGNHCYSAQRRLLELIKTDSDKYDNIESDLLITFTASDDTEDITCNSEIDILLKKIEKDSKKRRHWKSP